MRVRINRPAVFFQHYTRLISRCAFQLGYTTVHYPLVEFSQDCRQIYESQEKGIRAQWTWSVKLEAFFAVQEKHTIIYSFGEEEARRIRLLDVVEINVDVYTQHKTRYCIHTVRHVLQLFPFKKTFELYEFKGLFNTQFDTRRTTEQSSLCNYRETTI